jgi:hypothetical protein
MHRYPQSAVLLCAVALVCLPGAATAKIATVESLEWMTVSSDRVFAGKVIKIEPKTADDRRPYQLVTIAVARTLKGDPAERITFQVWDSRLDLKGWMDDGLPVLWFLTKDTDLKTPDPTKVPWKLRGSTHNRNCVIPLRERGRDEGPTVRACTRECTILTRADEIYQRVEKTARSTPREQKPKRVSIEAPVDSAVFERESVHSAVYVTVPASALGNARPDR